MPPFTGLAGGFGEESHKGLSPTYRYIVATMKEQVHFELIFPACIWAIEDNQPCKH